MIKHYMTKYETNDPARGELFIFESWLQLEIFNWTWPFSRKRYVAVKGVPGWTREEGKR